ncbi:DUF2357 domain-containing protein [Aeromonas hydrophila]|uniref:DUF2357 domain-containing protein n=1 Tax=Aeromonas hydrophila TaxID=644 RepID=UPI00039C0A9C|nr:DUF2357 domain-containing protein [Aeromonas hydrophila]EGX6959744.1 DUF2357 domain-containing protein [Aeromonas hydrophila]MBC6396151.1 DUF2357 domain-containing protein [Aeromonas hydrophila]MCA4701085.1 DUF2357 domain-containing protein [Aeromonas hydrophila]OLN99017.1 hypothetical protein BS650_18740 [Aeromonas hydrophila]ORJ68980.1 hypothetical protein B5717_05115 [Aeromonas hydrophila]
MKLTAKIINGKRCGLEIELTSFSHPSSNQIFFLEDEALEFRLEVAEPLYDVFLCLHENEIGATNSKECDGLWVYEWKPKSIYRSTFECFFHNYYGMAELSIVTKIDGVGERVILEQYVPVEVLAKKLNADRAEKMLEFLSFHDNDALAAFFRVTRLKAGFKEGEKSVVFLIEQLERNVLLLITELPKIYSKPIAKLIPVTKVIEVSERSVVDDTTLAWIAENSDCLYPVDDQDRALLELDGRYYSSDKILENYLKEDVNIYENQVIHGFIISLMRAASDIMRGLEDYPSSKIRAQSSISGYLSFFTQLNKFAKAINKNKVARCKELILHLQRLKRTFDERVPVSCPVIGTPKFTRKARYNLHYQKIFHKIIAWHRFGAPDWSVQEELFSIKSIPKLFEYYLLFLIKHHFDNTRILEMKLDLINSPVAERTNFEYDWGGYTVRLFYEMKAWTHDHSNSSGATLINSEGWTTNSVNGELKPRGQHGPYANRSPDMIVCILAPTGEQRQLVLDAKYTTSKKAFTHYLPELTMKYLHGIHEKNTGNSFSAGLMIVNPSELCETRHFHHSRYSIYGASPVTPALLVSSVSPGMAEGLDSDFRSNLSQFLILMRMSLSGERRRSIEAAL